MTDLRKQKTSDTTISNQDKTVTANGKYTADENYTGLGTVTVSVPPTPQENFINLGATIDSNGVASNFSGSNPNHATWGGLSLKWNENFFTDNRFNVFQIAFTTPEELPEWMVVCGTPYPNKAWNAQGGAYDFILNANITGDKIYFYGLGYFGLATDVTLNANSYYIVKLVRNTDSDNGIYVSADNGVTWTKISAQAPSEYLNMRNTQFGYFAGYNKATAAVFAGTIDLKNTGFKNTVTNEKYMLLQ